MSLSDFFLLLYSTLVFVAVVVSTFSSVAVCLSGAVLRPCRLSVGILSG